MSIPVPIILRYFYLVPTKYITFILIVLYYLLYIILLSFCIKCFSLLYLSTKIYYTFHIEVLNLINLQQTKRCFQRVYLKI